MWPWEFWDTGSKLLAILITWCKFRTILAKEGLLTWMKSIFKHICWRNCIMSWWFIPYMEILTESNILVRCYRIKLSQMRMMILTFSNGSLIKKIQRFLRELWEHSLKMPVNILSKTALTKPKSYSNNTWQKSTKTPFCLELKIKSMLTCKLTLHHLL